MASKRRAEVKSTITALPPGWYLPHLHLHEIILIILEVFSNLSDSVTLWSIVQVGKSSCCWTCPCLNLPWASFLSLCGGTWLCHSKNWFGIRSPAPLSVCSEQLQKMTRQNKRPQNVTVNLARESLRGMKPERCWLLPVLRFRKLKSKHSANAPRAVKHLLYFKMGL